MKHSPMYLNATPKNTKYRNRNRKHKSQRASRCVSLSPAQIAAIYGE